MNKITAGEYTYGHDKISVHSFGEESKIYIGKFCSIASGVEIFIGGNHRVDWFTTYPFGHINQNVFPQFSGEGHPSSKGDVIIGNDVWIGQGACIMSGVTIGDGCVIGANSVVSKNIEPYSIVVGNPCVFVRKRFDIKIINLLLEIKWWNWDIAKINDNLEVFCSSDENKLKNIK